jgi:sulfoxide reductase heme-binding subunit YedZ
MIALTQSLALWYLTRGSGAFTLVLLTLVFALGTPTLLSWDHPLLPRLVVQMVHRNLSLLVVVFVMLHVATTVVDSYAPIGWLDAVFPFRSGYRPFWLGLGTLAVDLLLAIVLTSLARVHMRYRSWRNVHLLAYAMWPLALVHGLGTGSDRHAAWMWWVDGCCTALVIASTVVRLRARPVSWRRAVPAQLVRVDSRKVSTS